MNRRTRTVYLVPYVLWILLFVVAPILLIVYYSFFDVYGNFTVDNCIHFFTPVYLKMTAS
ncbi:TPA: ABC transporter permease, partial [Listeria monocytogenes]|nr:ABC transporter permease [Listeria monocytogenes]